MTYTLTPKEQLAEDHAKARIEFDSATADERDCRSRAAIADNELQALRGSRKRSVENAHAALDRLAAEAETIVARTADNWLNSLLLPNPQGPPGEVGTAYLLTDPAFIRSMHAHLDRIATDPQHGGIHDRSIASIDEEVEVRSAELAEYRAAAEAASTRVAKAASRVQDFELGRVRVNS